MASERMLQGMPLRQIWRQLSTSDAIRLGNPGALQLLHLRVQLGLLDHLGVGLESEGRGRLLIVSTQVVLNQFLAVRDD